MRTDLPAFARAVWASVTEPSATAAKVMRVGLTLPQTFAAITLVSVLQVLLVVAFQSIAPLPPAEDGTVPVFSPFSFAALLWVLLVVFSASASIAGRFFGGTATFAVMLKIMAWFQAVNLTLFLGEIVLTLALPILAGPYTLFMLVVLVFMQVQFLRVAHGFEGVGLSVLTLLVALILSGLWLALLASLFTLPI